MSEQPEAVTEDVTDYDLSRLEAEAAESEQAAQAQTSNAQGDTLPDVPTADLVRPIVDLGCGVLVPAWGIQEQERRALADSYAAVIDKWFPDTGLGAYAVEVNALLLTAAILGPRLHLPKHEQPEPERQAEEKPMQKKGKQAETMEEISGA